MSSELETLDLMKAFLLKLTVSALGLLSFQLAEAAPSPGEIVGWGWNPVYGCADVPYSEGYATGVVTISGQVLADAVAISAGWNHCLALRKDGTVFGWGQNHEGCAIGRNPGDHAAGEVVVAGEVLSNITAVAAGTTHSLALRQDGTIVGWGDNQAGESTPPAGLTNAVAISAGAADSLALKADGTVVCWGMNDRAQAKAPAGLRNVVAIAASKEGYGSNLALKRNGTVVQWSGAGLEAPVPAGLSNVVAIAAGGRHYLALKNDGTVVGWGVNRSGEAVPPAGLSNVVAITAGEMLSVALKRDGSVVAWGNTGWGATTVPAGLSNVVAISAGSLFGLAITTNNAVAERFRH